MTQNQRIFTMPNMNASPMKSYAGKSHERTP
jgi:hypothetical protein